MGQSRVRECEYAGARIKERVEGCAVAPANWTYEHAFVQQRERGSRILPGFVDAAEHAHHQCPIERGRQAFADNIAEIQTDQPIRQIEEVREIAANAGKGKESI